MLLILLLLLLESMCIACDGLNIQWKWLLHQSTQ